MFIMFVKYGRREHIRQFFRDGTVQIGTVRSYDQTTFGNQIGDDEEGTSRQAIHDNNIDDYRNAGYSEPYGFGVGCRSNVVLMTNVCHNYAIYPVSLVLHADLCRNFDESYDTALVILEPFVFFSAVTSAFAASGLAEGVEFRHVQPVQYRSREIAANEFLQEEFIKDPRYGHQAEIRASWMIGNPDKNFYRFQAPWARWACAPVRIENLPSYAPGSDRDVIDAQVRHALKSGFATDTNGDW